MSFELYESDLEDFNDAVGRVWVLLRDGAWHYAVDIEEAAGSPGRPAREGLRRMRELRPLLTSRGLFIECRRVGGLNGTCQQSRDSVYRITEGDPDD